MLSGMPKWLRKPSDNQRYWDQALRILRTINPDLILAKRPLWERVWVRILFSLPRREFTDALLTERPSKTQVSTGVALPLKGKDKDSRAFEIQVRVLDYVIELRKALYRGELDLSSMPGGPSSANRKADSAKTSSRVAVTDADITIRSLMAQISDVSITSDAMNDIEADYWNKLASIAWEGAQYEREIRKGDPAGWLKRARQYIDIAIKGRQGNWEPAQLTLARITAMEGDRTKAIDILGRILGVEPPAPSQPPPAPQPEESDAIVALIKKMAIERDPKVLADIISKNYGTLSRITIRKITTALVGSLDSRFLDDLLRHLVSTSEGVTGKA